LKSLIILKMRLLNFLSGISTISVIFGSSCCRVVHFQRIHNALYFHILVFLNFNLLICCNGYTYRGFLESFQWWVLFKILIHSTTHQEENAPQEQLLIFHLIPKSQDFLLHLFIYLFLE
jgi:hypothetical protein